MTEEKIVVKRPPRSPALAGILAAFLPFGVGAFYNRQIYKGFMFLLIFAGIVTMNSYGAGQPFWGLILAGFYFYQIFDAVQEAKRFNRIALEGKDIEDERIEDIPELVKTGSIFWGIVLIALGGLFLLANFDIVSYDFIWDFWPLAVIVIGLKLILDYFKKSQNKED
jgi:hypothetical protein